MNIAHLARRFFASLRPGGPAAVDERWALARLNTGEAALWRRMSDPDRRHAVGVARAVVATLGVEATDPVVAAALLHDVGKIDSHLTTLARVGATLLAALGGRERLASGRGRLARYLRHDEIGAALLREAGSDPLTVTWAAEHHQPRPSWTLPGPIAHALKAADDD